jgi:formylglycine-generating enzyme
MRQSLAIFLLGAVAVALPLTALADSITMAWTPVGNPGNAADSNGYGAVGYSYNIGTYDVTVGQYVEFLNAKDATGANTLGIYNANMSDTTFGGGGVSYDSAAASGNKYGVISGDGDQPINNVTFYDTLRFANWMNNGQGNGSTETGAYTLLGGTPTPSNANSITRDANATVFLPSEDEWYKAAYYNPSGNSYYSYPTSSDAAPTASGPTAAPNSANYNGAVTNVTNVGAYSGTASPYGAFDMGGDVWQWNETLVDGLLGWARVLRGGSFNDPSIGMQSSFRAIVTPETELYSYGFRVAGILTPEPSTLVMFVIGAAALLASGLRNRR